MFGANNNNQEALAGREKQEGQTMNNQQEPQYQQPQGGPGYQGPPGGYPYPAPPPVVPSRRKSPAMATWLSCFPGLGQVYVGYYQTGFTFALTAAGSIAILSSSAGRGIEPFLGTFLAFFWIFNMIDANRRAQHYNRVVEGFGSEEIPEDFKSAGGRGSVPLGVILVGVGVLFLLDLNFGISLDWLENWWPLALVGFGGWLIFKARQNGK